MQVARKSDILPGTQMGRDKDNAFSAGQRFLKMLFSRQGEIFLGFLFNFFNSIYSFSSFFLQVPKHAYDMIYKFTRGQSLIAPAPSTVAKGEPAAVLRSGRKEGPFILTSEQ